MILAPLRGVTIRCFREVFADIIRETGFTEAVTPFIPAMAGSDPLKDRELRDPGSGIRDRGSGVRVTPQFIGKDPVALRECLEKVKAAGFETADLNAGCPYPMVRNKGRGSGLLRTPDVLRRMLEVGCEVMGAGKFSLPEDESRYNIVAKYNYAEYPGNPNGSDYAVAGICSHDGRHLAMMPHLERAIFPWQNAWYPADRRADEVTPWIEAFVNARKWVEEKTRK